MRRLDVSDVKDWIEEREVPNLFGSKHVGVLTIQDLALFYRRFIRLLNHFGGCYSEHTRRYCIQIEASIPECHFHVLILSVWNGSDFENKFKILADKRVNFSPERFEEVIAALKKGKAT